MVCSGQKSLLSPLWMLGQYLPISSLVSFAYVPLAQLLFQALLPMGKGLNPPNCAFCLLAPGLWLPIEFRRQGAEGGNLDWEGRSYSLPLLVSVWDGRGCSGAAGVANGDSSGHRRLAGPPPGSAAGPQVSVALVQGEIGFLWLLISQ